MSGKLILWGVASGRALRVHWMLHELGLAYDIRPIRSRTGETQTPEYTALNPRQKIPLLQDGDFTIAESPAIIAYLAEKYAAPDRQFIPADPLDHARWLEWCFFVAMELDATSLFVIRRHDAKRGLPHIYGEAPAAVTASEAYFRKQLQHAEKALSDGRDFLVGGAFTTADILLATCLTWAVDYGIAITPHATRYREKLIARPACAAAVAANTLPPRP